MPKSLQSKASGGNGVVTPFPPEEIREGNHCLWFGCDYLRLTFGNQYESGLLDRYFSGLSENSNETFDNTFFGLSGFKFNALFLKDRKVGHFTIKGCSVVQITKMLSPGALRNCSWIIDFYSSSFHMSEMVPVITKMLVTWKDCKDCRITRCDLAADFDLSTYYFWRSRATRFKKNYVITKNKHIETFYLGRKEKNKKHFIRVYDKKIDSQKKGKFGLYGHYIASKKPVTRVEVEMHVHTLDKLNISIEKMLDFFLLEKLYDKKSYLLACFIDLCGNRNASYFPAVAALKKYGVPTIKKTLSCEKKEFLFPMEQLQYAKVMLSYARTLQEAGFDPLMFLTEHLEVPKGT